MVHRISLQDVSQVCLSCIVGMNEMDEFKFRPKLLSSSQNLKLTDAISIDAGVGVYAFLV